MIDPDDIDVDENHIYIRTEKPQGTVIHPLDRGETDPRRLTIRQARRGGWSVQFIELDGDKEDVAAALVADPHGRFERLTPGEFAALLESRPDYTYLRAASKGIAERLQVQERGVEIADPEQIAAESEVDI